MEPQHDDEFQLKEDELLELFREHRERVDELKTRSLVEDTIRRVEICRTVAASGDFASRGVLETMGELLNGVFQMIPAALPTVDFTAAPDLRSAVARAEQQQLPRDDDE